MTITLIAAMSKNQVIGVDNKLPWHLPKDLHHFKQNTTGKTIIMGRNTFNSIGFALPNRQNIVVTKTKNSTFKNCQVANSIDEAISLSRYEVMIVGGASLYEQTITKADQLILTVVDIELEGDACFPKFNKNQWQQISSELHHKDFNNQYSLEFITYKKLSANTKKT